MSFEPLSRAFFVASFMACAFPCFAQDHTGPNMEGATLGQRGGVSQFDMALGLYALGLAHKDALLALTAAKLALGVQMADVKREGVQKAAEGVQEEVDVALAPADAVAMLAAARSFAADDEALLELIEAVEGAKARMGGASRQLNLLPGGASDAWKIAFFGESLAEVGVYGDGDAPLVVVVTDEGGNRVPCPAASLDRFYCDFVPRWNGYFTVSVANQGLKPNSYFLLTN